MTFYTITITPDDTARGSTTLRVDVSESTPRITELVVRAGTDSGLSARALPAVDLDLLLRAITPGAPVAKGKAVTAAGGTAAPVVETTAPAATAAAAEESAPASGRRRRGAKSTGRGRAGTAKASAKETEPGARASRSRSADRAARRGSDSPRAYRRAPGDLLDVYQRVGGVTALAGHYGVPRHTAQSWIRRLRAQGVLSSADQ
jgi:hypothetical protein